MKKKYLGLLFIALMIVTVLVVVSCKKEPVETKVTVTFDTQGATTNAKIDPVSVDPGSVVAKPKKTPKRAGYTFLGWFDDKEGTKAHDFKAKITESMTVYACWQNQTEYEHSDPILPKGSVASNSNSFTIPMTWSTDANGKTGLPAVTYSFSGERTSETNVSKALVDAVKETPQSFFASTPKNIIFLFSDGWGVTEVNMSREYKGELIMDSLPYATESKTDSYKQYQFDGSVDSNYTGHETTDSCAGGTQVLAGYKTRYGYISMDVDANPVTTLIEAAHAKGMKTANVTNDNIVDATPADAMMHDTNRYHSNVLYLKALRYALVQNDLDLLMGWDWGMSNLFSTGDWATKLLTEEKEGIADAVKRQKIASYSGNDPVAYFKSLSLSDKRKMAGFSVYYYLWESQDPERLNSFMRWDSEDNAELAAYKTWLGSSSTDSTSGLAAAITALGSLVPSTAVNRYKDFKSLVQNTDYEKPILGSWTEDGSDYEASSPNRGYLIHGDIGTKYPSWPEMVAYTIYQMDKEADEAGDCGFFCIVENTCTDGWGHSGNSDTKVYGMMNEVQCFDEGVAIAVKYVLEHPDTLLVISADHETGAFRLKDGWENDFTKVTSTGTGHSSQRVPLYAFGAGADKFSAESIATKYATHPNAGLEEGGKIHEGWIAGALMGELITGSNFGLTGVLDYKGQAIDHGTSDDPYGGHLY